MTDRALLMLADRTAVGDDHQLWFVCQAVLRAMAI